MRRYLGLGVLIAVATLAILLWSKSSIEVTNAKAVRASAGISPHEIMSNSKNLPVEHVENPM
jgi:hypothetical protein